MIFLTIGSHEPFDRLVQAVDEWSSYTAQTHEIVAQVVSPASGAYIPKNFEMIPHLSPRNYEELILQADLIVSHAGMGSILTAFTHGKPIVIMPRRGHLRETRNDHQYTTIKNLKERPGLFIAEDETELSDVIEATLAENRADRQARLSPVADAKFTDAIRSFIVSRRER
jgi:UDP-N-acetylglucosamine transferase subunit ALG13